ncbi:heterodisulfide reductase-related iron-sulfur binding cluster [Halorubrum amylolyticum]|uniref:heterodisulfide reductase-related iron-sulfur binding cluster n=1 Tax=Halorubrum amylolyticum TaxID=2508724 RepID=UPI001008C8B7|nr:(Fe-S)-binding protein [Halorubrum amylolyticum]
MQYPLQASEPITRPTMWQIGHVGEVIFYFLAAVTVLVFLYGVYERFAEYAKSGEDWFDRLDDIGHRIASSSKVVLSNEKQFDRDFVGGLMHTFILWGFLTLLIGTTILAIDMDIYQTITGLMGEEKSFFVGDFYLSYSLILDAMGLLFVVGIGIAIYRRYVVKTSRLEGPNTGLEDDLFIWSLFLLGVGGYLTEGIRILGQNFPSFETVSFVGWFVADVLQLAGVDPAMARSMYPFAWWSHALIAFVFIGAIPYSKPLHMLTSYASVITRDEKAGKRLPSIPADMEATIGAPNMDAFSWREKLEQDACTNCGRCTDACPAHASGRDLSPRDVILDLKAYREQEDGEEKAIIGDGDSVIQREAMESCMSCMACMDTCPVEIEHLKTFTKLNRQLTDEGEIQPALQDVFQNVMQKGNTFGNSQNNRAGWTDDLEFDVTDVREEEVEYLWYVGDYPSYDERNKAVARSLATLFEEAGIKYGILFEDEVYDGNDIRRVGEELMFIEQAATLIESFEDCEFDKIVCTDPHSMNTFKNEYPELDFEEWDDDPMMDFDIEGNQWSPEAEVQHWTQAVEELVSDGRLGLSGNELDYTVTYHDPCHLGRYNDEYEAPRDLIRATGCDLHEMPRNRADSYCCGGGGGGLWIEHEQDEKPSEERIREALEDTDAGQQVEKFVVACPMCMTMYEDGRKTGDYEDDIEIVDIAELLIEAVETSPTTASSQTSVDPTLADD